MRLTPASRHMSTCRRAWVTSVDPTFLNGPRPPNVIVPMVSTETRRPDLPSARYSMGPTLPSGGRRRHDRRAPATSRLSWGGNPLQASQVRKNKMETGKASRSAMGSALLRAAHVREDPPPWVFEDTLADQLLDAAEVAGLEAPMAAWPPAV